MFFSPFTFFISMFISVAFGAGLGADRVREDLFQVYQQEVSGYHYDSKRILDENQKAFLELKSYQPEPSQGRMTEVSRAHAQRVVAEMAGHPVVGYKAEKSYDPEGRFGFCFGRAIFAHLELLRRGVNKDSIRKVFAVGPMVTGTMKWQFHVATVVKGPGSTWWALDRNFGEALSLEDWTRKMKTFDTQNQVRFYVTDPRKIGPSGWEYNVKPGGLSSYNGYFEDLFKSLKNEPVQAHQKWNAPLSCKKILSMF